MTPQEHYNTLLRLGECVEDDHKLPEHHRQRLARLVQLKRRGDGTWGSCSGCSGTRTSTGLWVADRDTCGYKDRYDHQLS